MNSEERREARYQRRKAKREEKKAIRNADHTFQKVTEFGSLRKSFYKARRGTNWKASVQKYGCNVLRNSYVISRKMRKHQKISKGFIEFDLYERGKIRHISSVHITERVPQKAVCDYGIVPIMEKSLIYENGASQEGKGTGFSSDQLIKDLRRHYRKSGFTNSGYIVMGDGHDFFASLRHDVIYKNMYKMITDQELIRQTMDFISPFGKGLGLGSQVCQINAVAYANAIDHYIKDVLRKKYYCRHMDDWYVIVDTKEEADKILRDISQMYAEIGIEMNPKKTQKIKLSHGFTWLQDRYFLTEKGKVIRKASHKRIAQYRKKLKKMAVKVENGEMDYNAVRSFYASISGYLAHKDGYLTKRSLANLYNQLFIEKFMQGGMRDEQIFAT